MTSATGDADKAEKKSGVRDLLGLGAVFWIAIGVYLLDSASYYGMLNIATLFFGHDLKMGDRLAGLTVSYYTGIVTLGSALLGGVIDRVGVRRAITYACALALGGRALLTMTPNLPAPIVTAWLALTLMAVSAGTMTTAVYAAVKQSTTKATSSVGFSLLYAALNGGVVLESLFASLVRARSGPQGVYAMCTAFTLTYFILHLVGFPKGAGGPIASAEDRAEDDAGAAPKAKAKASLKNHALLQPRFLYFIFILLPVRTLFAHQWLTMPDYVTRAYPPDVGARFEWIVDGLNPLLIIVLTPLAAVLTSRVHVVKMMVWGTLVSAAASFLLVPGPETWRLLGYVFVFSVGEALWSSRFYEWIASSAPPDKVGVYMGAATVPWFVAKFTTGFYSGYMLERFCPPGNAPKATGTMWLVYGVFALISPIGLFAARRWLMAKELT